MGTGVSFPRIKRPGHEFDKELPTSAEVEYQWSDTSIQLYASMAWTGTTLTKTFAYILKQVVIRFNQQPNSRILFMVESLK
jgi:hypothetical protein